MLGTCCPRALLQPRRQWRGAEGRATAAKAITQVTPYRHLPPSAPVPPAGQPSACGADRGWEAWDGLLAISAQRSPASRTRQGGHGPCSHRHCWVFSAPLGLGPPQPCTDLGFRVLPLIPLLFDTLVAGPQLKPNAQQ